MRLAGVPTLDLRSACIIVSGQPPVTAHAVYANGHCVGLVAQGTPLPWETPTPAAPPPRKRCARCRAFAALPDLADPTLGLEGFCFRPGCRPSLVSACRRKHRRLPDPSRGEFFCPRCLTIRPGSARCAPERDGRQRRYCQICRDAQPRADGYIRGRSRRLLSHAQGRLG